MTNSRMQNNPIQRLSVEGSFVCLLAKHMLFRIGSAFVSGFSIVEACWRKSLEDRSNRRYTPKTRVRQKSDSEHESSDPLQKASRRKNRQQRK